MFINFPFFHIRTVHLHIIKVFYSPTDIQVNHLKNNFKIYIKMNIKTAPNFDVDVVWFQMFHFAYFIKPNCGICF